MRCERLPRLHRRQPDEYHHGLGSSRRAPHSRPGLNAIMTIPETIAAPQAGPTRVAEHARTRTLRQSSYPGVAGQALVFVARRQVRRWDRALAQVQAEQEGVLENIVRHAEGTEFGRRYGFHDINHYGDFARNVPVGDYDS